MTENYIVCKLNIADDGTLLVRILGLLADKNSIDSISVDDTHISIDDLGDSRCYQFESTGEHTITYYFTDTVVPKHFVECCFNITSVEFISDSITKIGAWAFFHCDNMTNVIFNQSITVIEDYAFGECGVHELDFPQQLETINDNAFIECNDLEHVTMYDNVSYIGLGAFSGCGHISDIVAFPQNAPYITDTTFYKLKDKESTGGILYVDGNSNYDGWYYNEGTENKFYLAYGDNNWQYPPEKLIIIEYYTQNKVEITDYTAFGGNYIRHTFNNGRGCLYFKGEGPTSIPNGIFENNSTLVKVKIPYSVTDLGDTAFYGCTSLSNIISEAENAPSVHANTFYNVHDYGTLDYPEGSDYSNWLNTDKGYLGYALWNYDTSLESSIPYISASRINNPTNINAFDKRFIRSEYSVFENDGNFVFYGDVTKIMANAFMDCSELQGITIPETITSIGENAFANCTGLTDIYAEPLTAPTIENNTFYNIGIGGDFVYPEDSDYDSWLSTEPYYLGYYGWNGLGNIYKIEFTASAPLSLQQTDNFGGTFLGIKWDDETNEGFIAFITPPTAIPGSNDYHEAPFYNNTSLLTMTLPNTISSIGKYAFYGCNSLAEMDLGEGLSSMGDECFYQCGNLKDLNITAQVPPTITNLTFHGIAQKGFITYPEEVTEYHDWLSQSAYYLGYYGWNHYYIEYVSDSELHTVYVGDTDNFGANVIRHSFDAYTNIGYIEFMEPPTTVSSSVFSYNTDLKEIYLADTITNFEPSAFTNDTNLTTVKFPKKLRTIGESCFLASGITYADMSYTKLDTLGFNVFTNCSGLKTVKFPETITDIPYATFTRCQALETCTIPGSIQSIGSYAFDKCVSISSITLNEGLERIGDYAFRDCQAFTDIEFPDSLLTIGMGAFTNNTNITSLSFGSSLSTIGADAFKQCENLELINITATSAPTLYSTTFQGVKREGVLNYPPSSNYQTWLSQNQYYLGFYDWDLYKIHYTATQSVTPYSTTAFGNAKYINTTFDSETGNGYLSFIGIVNELGSNAFRSRSSLISIEIPDSVTSIGNNAFYSCSSLASIEIPDSVTSIGTSAFSGCSSLASIEIGNGVTSIGNYAFEYCSSLANITIPDSVTSIGTYTFSSCSSLENITVEENNPKYDSRNDCNAIVETATNTLIVGCKNTVIPDSVISIGNYAFYRCSKLTNIVIPDSVTSIRGSAFAYCSSLENIEIGNGVTSIGDYAFQGCSSLTDIEIGNGVTSIGSSAFISCSSLASIVIPDSVTSIGYQAFYNCSSLERIEIGNGVTSIGEYTFRNCSSLESITCYAMTAPTIQYDTFQGVKSNGVLYVIPGTNYNSWMSTSSYYLGYYKWTKLSASFTVNNITNQRPAYTVYANTINIPIRFNANITAHGVTLDITDSVTITIEKNTTGSDRTLTENFTYKGYTTSVTFTQKGQVNNKIIYYTSTDGATVTPYSTSAFGGATIVSNTYNYGQGIIEFNKNITSIGSQAFYNCSKLASIYILDSVTSIGSQAFYNCSSLESIEIPDSVTSIESSSFSSCSKLSSIKIGNGVTSIGSSAFLNCSSLESIVIHDSVTSIGDTVFRNCSKLASIEIGNGVTSIGNHVFQNCSLLVSITVGENNQKYDSRNDCNAIVETTTNTLIAGCKNTVIPDSVTSIGNEAFYYCSSLASIEIPDSVTSIGSQAFYNCSSLDSITCYAMTAPSITSNTFQNVKSNGVLYVIPGTNYNSWMSTSSYYLGYYKWTKLSASFTVNNITNQHTASTVYANTTNSAIIFDANITVNGKIMDVTDSSTITIEKNTTGSDRTLTENFTYNGYTSSVTFVQKGVEGVPENLILYTSTDRQVVTPYSTSEFGGATILNNTYDDGQGIIEFDRDLTSIGSQAFYYCSSLASIVIPYSVTSIGSSAFYKCSSLANIEIPDSVTSIGTYTFAYCSSLASIEIPNSVTSIGSYVFENCSSLASIEIPNSVTSIGNNAFSGCSSLASIEIPDSVTSIGERVFQSCSLLANVTIGNGVTVIPYAAFYNSHALKNVVLGRSVKSVSAYAFENCSSLESITCYATNAPTITNTSFYNNTKYNGVLYIMPGTDYSAWLSKSSYYPGYYGWTKLEMVITVNSITNQHPVSTVYANTTNVAIVFDANLTAHGVTWDITDSVTITIEKNTTGSDRTLTENFTYKGYTSSVTFTQKGQVNNKIIYYTSTDGAKVTPHSTSAFGGATIVSNTYNYGQGIIEFDTNITSIGYQAFYQCSKLESIEIPDSVTSIGSQAFQGCSKLTSIDIPNSVTSIGDSAFRYCSKLTSIEIPDSVTSIGYYTFSGCSSLANVEIGNGVTSIGGYAFSECSSLESIEIPDSVTSIGERVFQNCSSLESIEIPDSVTSIGNNAFQGCSSLESIEIPDSVTSIGDYTFSECSSLANIVIPDSVTSIGWYAFSSCSSLTSIEIPDSVTSIGNYAFQNCFKLENITCYAMTAPTIQSNTFQNVKRNGVLYKPSGTNYNTWMSISYYYLGYYNWTILNMAITVNSITNQHPASTVYANTTNIKIVFDANITVNGKTMDITDKVAISIEKNTTGSDRTLTENFTYNGYTSSVTFTQLGEEGVPENQIWYTSTNGATVTPYSTSAFGGATIVNNTYNDGQGIIEFNRELTSIGENAFKNCSSLASIVIPDSVTSIGNSAFYECSKLASIVIPDSVTSIVERAFYNCSSLASIVIPDSVTSIEYSTFYHCSSLASIVIPDSVTSIGNYAFSGCSLLASIEIGNGVTSIGDGAFYNCSSLASIEIPDSVTSIGSYVFYNCSSLASIEIPDSVTSIGDSVFYGCSLLASIVVSEGNTKYDSRNNCNAIVETATNKLIVGCKNTVIPNSVTSIGSYAFQGCSSLSNIEIPDSVTSIGSYAFSGCSSLASIEIPNSVTSIGNYAFQNCSSLANITCYAMTAPTIQSYTFYGIKRNGILYVISGTNYSAWTSTSSYYLGYYGWNIVYRTAFTFDHVETLTIEQPNPIAYSATSVEVQYTAVGSGTDYTGKYYESYTETKTETISSGITVNDTYVSKSLNLSFTFVDKTESFTVTQGAKVDSGVSISDIVNEYTGLTVTGDDVEQAKQTTTTLHYTLSYKKIDNTAASVTGTQTSSDFGENTSGSDRTVTLSLTLCGQTATCTITQGTKGIDIPYIDNLAFYVPFKDNTTVEYFTNSTPSSSSSCYATWDSNENAYYCHAAGSPFAYALRWSGSDIQERMNEMGIGRINGYTIAVYAKFVSQTGNYYSGYMSCCSLRYGGDGNKTNDNIYICPARYGQKADSGWHWYTATRISGTVYSYRDASQTYYSSGWSNLNNRPEDFSVCELNTNNTQFDMYVKEVRIYNRVLTASEIANL